MGTDNLYRKKLGAWGEELACVYLREKSYQLLEKNYHTQHGEIDLIMKSGDQLIAVEVKTRRSTSFGEAEHSITRKKYLALQAAMNSYMEYNPDLGPDWQLDIIVIENLSRDKTDIIHYENIYLDYLNG